MAVGSAGGLIEGMMADQRQQPIVGISANWFPREDRKFYKNKDLQLVEASMVEAVHKAGAVPYLLPILEPEACEALLEPMDGLVLSGGADISPLNYGEPPADPAWAGQPVRDAFEIGLYRAARKRGLPVLGVCRGAP